MLSGYGAATFGRYWPDLAGGRSNRRKRGANGRHLRQSFALLCPCFHWVPAQTVRSHLRQPFALVKLLISFTKKVFLTLNLSLCPSLPFPHRRRETTG